jgi:enolase
MKIDNINLIEILDSRGDPTIECHLYSGNYFGIASVPTGASVGSNEVYELRDKNDLRYCRKGLKNVIANFYLKYKDLIINRSFNSQEEFDYFLISLDSSSRKEHLGGNVALSLSLSFADLL